MQYFSYLLTRGMVEFIGLLPLSVIYRISDLLGWLFFKFGYRKAVVYGNLRRCFPEKSEAEIHEIARTSYQNLADVTLESIKGSTMPVADLESRYQYRDAEILNQFLRTGRSVMLTGGHFNNWEWAVLTVAKEFHGLTFGVYKRMSNKYLNDYFFKTRDRSEKMVLTEMKETYAAVEQHNSDGSVFILVSDQSPSNRATAQWVEFLGQKTACLPGVDVISRQHNFPVVFFHTERVGRGRYEMSFSLVLENAAATEPSEINQKVAAALEEKIRQNPGSWLWSHRRWKMQPS